MLGRDDEIRQALELIDTLRIGQPAVLVLEGPPGSGLTRLLAEITDRAARSGVTTVAEPDWITAGDARRLLQHPRDRSGPILFTSDHPRRIDGRVWGVLDLLATYTPVLVVVTGRVEPDRLTAEHLLAAETHRIRVAPLAAAEVAELAARELGGRPAPAVLDLCRVAAGRPGVLGELLAGLRAEGLVRVEAGRATLVAARLPRVTRARLTRQFALLSPAARHLLQAATTVRDRFPLARLTRLLQAGPVALLPALDEVLASGLLDGESELLAFRHELVRELVEATMPRPVVAALRDQQPRTAARPPAARPSLRGNELSAREQEIARLAGAGLTNRQIASRLAISPHTVNFHLRQIFQKLGIGSRVELAHAAARSGRP
jgi:DNA-binding NarL/FixJ family response regulator